MEFCQAVFREGEGARFELEQDHQLGPLWLPQVLNQGLIHQCTCFSHVRAGAFQLLVYQTVRVCGQIWYLILTKDSRPPSLCQHGTAAVLLSMINTCGNCNGPTHPTSCQSPLLSNIVHFQVQGLLQEQPMDVDALHLRFFSSSDHFHSSFMFKEHLSAIWEGAKHRKNCECCHHHSVFKGHKVIVHIVVLNCQKCNQCLKRQVSGHNNFQKIWKL